MAWSDIAQSNALGAGVSAASGLFGGLFNLFGARQQYKNQKKLMALQNQYDIEAFDREVQAQKDLSQYMAENANTWQKTSLQNAGYSTADPQGTGIQTAGVSAPSQDVPGTPTAPYVDYSSPWQTVSDSALKMAQIANLNADTKIKGNENEILKLDIEKYKSTLDTQIEMIKSEYNNLTKQNAKFDAEIDNIREVTANLNIDTKFKVDTFDKRKEELLEQVESLIKDNKIKSVHEKLAEYGIVVGLNDIQTLISTAEFGKTDQLINVFNKVVETVASKMPETIKAVFKGLWEGAKSAVGLGD